MTKKQRWILIAPLAILAMIGFIALGGLIVEQLWNWLLPPLFGWHPIAFWQALGILLLARILFGGWGGGHRSYRSGLRRKMSDRMSDRMMERLEQMTPEERERFQQRMRERWGFGPPPSQSQGQ